MGIFRLAGENTYFLGGVMEEPKYTIGQIEDMANAWSWASPENRRDYRIIIDFLCFIKPELADSYKMDSYAGLTINKYKR